MSAYTGLWIGLHLQLAQLTDTPELAITEADGKAFLGAVQNVARHYSIAATQKTLDWAALVFTAGFIYVPRIAAVAKRHRAPPVRRQPAAQVFPFQVTPNPHDGNGGIPADSDFQGSA